MPVTTRPNFGSLSWIVCPPAMTAPTERTMSAPPRSISARMPRGQVRRERRDVEREQHPAAHRVDVAERVGRGDRTVLVGRVDDRREEVDGLDQRVLVVQPVHGGVVGRAKTDQQRPGADRPERDCPSERRTCASCSGGSFDAQPAQALRLVSLTISSLVMGKQQLPPHRFAVRTGVIIGPRQGRRSRSSRSTPSRLPGTTPTGSRRRAACQAGSSAGSGS